MAIEIGNLMQQLGSQLADSNFAAARTRTDQADRLRQLVGAGLRRRESIRDSLASQGLTHSGINNKIQTRLRQDLDDQRARLNQQYQDRLANIARERIQSEAQFNINSVIPR